MDCRVWEKPAGLMKRFGRPSWSANAIDFQL